MVTDTEARLLLLLDKLFQVNPSDWVTDEKSGESVNVTEAVMLNDTRFWKALRKSWYSVLIEGIMKDYEAKKKLARAFMKHYHRLMDDFVNDDQEDDYTITNMSLQACFLNTCSLLLDFVEISSTNLQKKYSNSDSLPASK